jgi:hypothetical protein
MVLYLAYILFSLSFFYLTTRRRPKKEGRKVLPLFPYKGVDIRIELRYYLDVFLVLVIRDDSSIRSQFRTSLLTYDFVDDEGYGAKGLETVDRQGRIKAALTRRVKNGTFQSSRDFNKQFFWTKKSSTN